MSPRDGALIDGFDQVALLDGALNVFLGSLAADPGHEAVAVGLVDRLALAKPDLGEEIEIVGGIKIRVAEPVLPVQADPFQGLREDAAVLVTQVLGHRYLLS